nr:synaptobrevin, longin-like domain protein [Tanacetum cinerariifolium]
QELASPRANGSCKELDSPKQTALGIDESNTLIVYSLLKTIWSSMHHVIEMKHWLFQSKRLLVNDVVNLQALIERKRVVVTEDIIRQDLRLDDVDGVECLPTEKIFAELARMGYEKPTLKLTFYKAFFSAQWKFLIHTLVQYVSAKRTAWNEFSCSMASAVICLATGRKFNFSK